MISALGIALLVNLLLFLVLPTLMSNPQTIEDITEPIAINLIRVRQKEPPPPEKKEEPEQKPPPEPPSMLKPDLRPPSLRSLAMDDVGLKVDVSMIEGERVGVDFVYDASQVDQVPMPLVPINPVYPYQAQRFSIIGHVRVGYVVDETGRASGIEVIESEPEGIFDESVRRALLRSRFRPGMVKGRPVPTKVVQTIRFDLE